MKIPGIGKLEIGKLVNSYFNNQESANRRKSMVYGNM